MQASSDAAIDGGGGVTHNPGTHDPDSVRDRGLALLPIVAILCGVALGLGTLGLGIILLVRRPVTAGGRRRRGCDSSNSSFSAGSPGTYDAVPGGGGASGRSTLSMAHGTPPTSEHFVMKGE